MTIPILHLLAYLATALYIVAVVLLAAYGLHSLWLLLRFVRHRRQNVPAPCTGDEPAVLVQLPVYNERDVVYRLVSVIGDLDWPKRRLRIQLLDDSTDDSAERGANAIARLRDRGYDAVQVRREDRSGFKAGALAHGLEVDARHPDGPAAYVAIFDADFLPPRDFLRRALPTLQADPACAFVQGRWEHLNPDYSLLTRAQAVGIDGHFAIEQGARVWSGLALNFNGTCGIWRREAIAAGGGWQHDTLTEDLDLSYRVQLAGWHGAYRLDVAVPGELPPTLEAWRAQQFRWAKGSLQTARKLLPTIWRSGWSWTRKVAATAHLTHYLVHPLILLSLILAPVAVPVLAAVPSGLLWVGGLLLACGMLPPIALYIASQRILGRGSRALLALPALTALGTGIAVSNSRAAWEALRGLWSEFVRTPKHGAGGSSYRAAPASGLPELAAAAWGGLGLLVAWHGNSPWLAPILGLYVVGFAHHGFRLFGARVREAVITAGGADRPWWALVPLGIIAVASMGVMAARDTSWREEPGLFAGAMLLIGVVYLLGFAIVRTRRIPVSALAWILAVGAALNLVGTGLWHSDDVHRYVVEGQQILAGQNPYLIPPADPAAQALVPSAISERVNHPEMTAIYPPFSLLVEAGVQALLPGLHGFTILACAASLLAIGLALALVVRQGLPPGLILAVAWNPVLPVFASGEAHNDIVMAVLLLIALLLATYGRFAAAVVTASMSVLVKPFAGIAMSAILVSTGWRRWWLAPLTVALLYLPFASAGTGLVASLLTFGGSMHFHGALDPWVRLAVVELVSPPLVEPIVRIVLFAALMFGSSWLWLRRGGAPLPTLVVRLLGVLLLCLPTLHPWYFIAIVVLLPFARSWALAVWTATAGVYWLHGLQILALGAWFETPWVTAVAHLPAMALMAWEVFGPRSEAREPGRLPLIGRFIHA